MLLQLVVLITTYYDSQTSKSAIVSLIISIIVGIVCTSLTFANVNKTYMDERVVSSEGNASH